MHPRPGPTRAATESVVADDDRHRFVRERFVAAFRAQRQRAPSDRHDSDRGAAWLALSTKHASRKLSAAVSLLGTAASLICDATSALDAPPEGGAVNI